LASDPTLAFLPSIRVSSATNCPSPAVRASVAAMLQYSSAMNAWISRSRSTTRRTATL
jgi:hypothetical protein